MKTGTRHVALALIIACTPLALAGCSHNKQRAEQAADRAEAAADRAEAAANRVEAAADRTEAAADRAERVFQRSTMK
jgi:outer membrane murein-binding lipoprotein Lpp